MKLITLKKMEQNVLIEIKEIIVNSLNSVEWDKTVFKNTFTESGSSSPDLQVFNVNGERIYFDFEKIFKVNSYFRNYFNSTQRNLEQRFNKVEFEINRDGYYKANYYWDEAEAKDQKLKTAEVFPIWLHERFLQFLFEAGYGDNNNWQKGVFKIHINKERSVNVETTLYNKDIAFGADPKFPKQVYDAILHHYEITNHGLLSDVFKKWDTLIIHSRYTSVDLEKDVEYHLES